MQEWPDLTANDVKAMRALLGMAQREFAESLCGTSRRNVEDWESGKSKPPAYLRLAVAALAAKLEPWTS